VLLILFYQDRHNLLSFSQDFQGTLRSVDCVTVLSICPSDAVTLTGFFAYDNIQICQAGNLLKQFSALPEPALSLSKGAIPASTRGDRVSRVNQRKTHE
jgi:hypothetical protein